MAFLIFIASAQCSAGGCLIELAQQLGVIMIGKQVVNNAQEILVPKMKAWWHKKKVNDCILFLDNTKQPITNWVSSAVI